MWRLAGFLLLAFWQNQPENQCSISGTVVDSITGQPLKKVEVTLEPLGGRTGDPAFTETDARGHFVLADLDPGRYHLKGKRSGYLEMPYGARRPNGDGAILRISAGQCERDLEFKLMPAGVIAGTARDSDGEPIEGAAVSLAKIRYERGRPVLEGIDSTDSDDRGEYRFRGLSPGKYYVGVRPRGRGRLPVDRSSRGVPKEADVPTFYPGSPDATSAAPIPVSPGEHVEGVDVTMLRSRVFRISGRVMNSPTTSPLVVSLNETRNAGVQDYGFTTRSTSAGEFEFRGVPPGLYRVEAGAETLQGITSVAVADSNVDGVRVALAPLAEVKVRIVSEGNGEPDLSRFDYFLTANGRSGYMSRFLKDRFTVANVRPGHYAVEFSGGLLSEYYLKQARAGDTDVLADGVTVGSGTAEIEITIAPDGGAVEGVVLDGGKQPIAGATVLLAPEKRARAGLFKSTTTDQSGRFEMKMIAPGGYKLFAWDDVEPDAWNDPEFLRDYERQGETVTVEPKGRASVRLTACPEKPSIPR